MLPTEDQAAALKATLRACNEAASWLSGRVHADRVRRKHDNQKRLYAELKGRFTLSAQPAIRVIGKVADAYSSLHANLDAGNYWRPAPRGEMLSRPSPSVSALQLRSRLMRGVCPGRSPAPSEKPT